MQNGVAMQSFPRPAEPVQKRSPITPLGIVLVLVFVFFCGVLVFVYIATKRINPVMLDQQGRPVNSQPAQSSQPSTKSQKPTRPSAAH
jgi:hypothetical protein